MIDTLALAKRLQKAGDTPEHAEALAEALAGGLNDHVATKSDVTALKSELKSDIAVLDAKIDTIASKLDAKIGAAALSLFIGFTAVMSVATALILTRFH